MNKTILDVCCGSRMFWFDKLDYRVVFCDKRNEDIVMKDSSSKTGIRNVIIRPDIKSDFTALPFKKNVFEMVVFDPPHLHRLGKSSWLAKKYGWLADNWRTVIPLGFDECMRVLKPGGTLIFKWNETEIKTKDILSLIRYNPLFGHISGRHSKTIWMSFVKKVGDV